MSLTNTGQSEHNDGHDTLKAVSGGAMLRVLRYPFVMLSMALIPRLMGDATYGQYAYYMSVFLILDIFSDIGFIQIFGRFVPECMTKNDRQGVRDILHGNLTSGLAITALLIAALYTYTYFRPIQNFPQQWVLIMSLQLLFTQIEGILFSFVYSLNRIERYSLKEIYRSAFTFTLVFVGYLKFGIEGALWGLVLNSFSLSMIALSWTWPWLVEKPVRVKLRRFKPYLVFGVQFYIPCFFYGLLQRSGNVFVRELTGAPQEVAYYDVANQFVLLLSSFLGLILSTLIPSLTKLHANDEQERIDQWQGRALTYCVIIAFCAFNALVWLGDFVISIVFGSEYQPVYANAIIAMLGMVAVLLASVGMNYSLLKKQPADYTVGVTLGMLVMGLGCLVLVPYRGALGASWATFAGYCALGGFFILRYKKHFLGMLKPVGLAVLAGVLIAPLYYFKNNQSLVFCLIAFAVSLLVYIALLFVVRAIGWKDVKELIRAFSASDDLPDPEDV